ncbi:MAG: hypothetical protein U9R51_06910 [Actinomycetota bacterium]|nr:hypothetical protein [Actinomycetota bacterium]
MTRKMIVLVGALMLVASACSVSGEATDAGSAAAPALTPTTVHTEAVTTADGSGTTSEGIQVHGHWTIEVRNPDGSLDEHIEFDNALEADGARLLAELLAGGLTVWNENYFGNDNSPWLIAFPESCQYGQFESATNAGNFVYGIDDAVSNGLLTIEASGVLMNNVAQPARGDTQITAVRTVVANLNEVAQLHHTGFTCKEIAPITVGANQSVYVTVEISFS